MIMGFLRSKNEDINLWILDDDRRRNRARASKEEVERTRVQTSEKRYRCFKCKETFDEPKLIHVCPHCLGAIEEKTETSCRYWFGYLGQKDKADAVPKECVECEKVVDCMLSPEHSAGAVSEIKKWY